ncbi:hypothetical protein Ocin01_01848 [Orchesella cincta]|uniref:Chitin-binding type-4 domain-containing protein n=1 Tax=Orchesella cincta TaxID=48709 RepID=A0A1D2NHV3_ORCCI|nr:hypothetical protein Ocin01_01848 [Orchesella cincta]
MAKFAIALIAALAVMSTVSAHGRFMKPASRSSVWRVPEFASQNPPANYDDNQLYCGGVHQADDPGTNCGVCGDPLSQGAPRDNELNGKYYKGIITGRYTAGQVIDIEVDLTTAHLGNMEWRLCTNPQSENQACFNQHVLQLANGSGTKLAAGPTGMPRTQVRLPAGVRCDHCVIQWNYRAGNGWGQCEDGSQGPGCGPQETFRGCSDISIS